MNVAIVGVTGAVGETILRVLDERDVPVETLGAFASRDRDEPLQFRGKPWPIRAATEEALAGYDVVFFASSEDASAPMARSLAARGTIVIDNSSTFRMEPGVPLCVPEINAHDVPAGAAIFPVANCTAIVLCMALAPVAATAGLRAVRVATYQAVSGAGRAGLDELDAAERALASGSPEPEARAFPRPIARNVVPQIGSFDAHGDSGEELKVIEETRKILGLPALHVAATTVRVPVRTAHSEAVFFETERDTDIRALGGAIESAEGVVFHQNDIVTPREVEGSDLVHVARLRAEGDSKRHFAMWVVGDQLRKGAATNAVQILQMLIERNGIRVSARV
jgi:aspartate-semialdehyde dehydrogenase